jgi:hypothetical protein
VSDPAQSSGSRVTAPPPEVMDALRELLDATADIHLLAFEDPDADGPTMFSKEDYERFAAARTRAEALLRFDNPDQDGTYPNRAMAGVLRSPKAVAPGPPPEPSEAMVEALAALQAVVDNSLCERCDPNGELLIRASDARRPLEAALAVSPGCRGAELAEAAEDFLEACSPPDWGGERRAALVEALAAFRASGEAGPDYRMALETLVGVVESEANRYMPSKTELMEAANEARKLLSGGHTTKGDQ